MASKRIETSRAPDGRYVWQIGEADSMGGMFACFFVESQSGTWRRVGKDGNLAKSNADTVRFEYKGTFFATRAEAMTAGRKARDAA
jgi:hypothetical protein